MKTKDWAVLGIIAGGLLVFRAVKMAGDDAPSPGDDAGRASKPETTNAPAAARPFDVFADEVESAYAKNEVHADQLYRSRELRVFGTVDSVGKNMINDDPYVLLASKRSFFGIRCNVEREHMVELGDLRPGQRVELRGVAKGKHVGAVMLDDCRVDAVASRTADRRAGVDAANVKLGPVGQGSAAKPRLTLDDNTDTVVVAGDCNEKIVDRVYDAVGEDLYERGIRQLRCANGNFTLQLTNE